jgi:hypothetical protein
MRFDKPFLSHRLLAHPKLILQYLYHVLKNQSSLPDEGLAMIRYHSFYPYVISKLLFLAPYLMLGGLVGTGKGRIDI